MPELKAQGLRPLSTHHRLVHTLEHTARWSGITQQRVRVHQNTNPPKTHVERHPVVLFNFRDGVRRVTRVDVRRAQFYLTRGIHTRMADILVPERCYFVENRSEPVHYASRSGGGRNVRRGRTRGAGTHEPLTHLLHPHV